MIDLVNAIVITLNLFTRRYLLVFSKNYTVTSLTVLGFGGLIAES